MATRTQHRTPGRDQGFTLIELLVVVLIIGVLAAIAIPVFLNQRKKAVDASVKSDLKNAATTAETIAADLPSADVFNPDPDGAGPATAPTIPEAFAAAGFKKTAGNYMGVYGGPAGGYCIRIWPGTAGSGTNGRYYKVYDSLAGGLQPGFHEWNVPCSAPGYVSGTTGWQSF